MKKKEEKEIWKEFPLGYKSKFRYAISNFGRLKSFFKDINKGKLLNGGSGNKLKILIYSFWRNGERITKHLYHHQLVAIFFLPGKTAQKNCIIHLDHNYQNNHVDNLKWVTRKGFQNHRLKDPKWVEAKRKLFEKYQKKNYDAFFGKIKRKEQGGVVKFYPSEEWKEISIPGKMHFRYGISNFGRIMSFLDKFEDGCILKPTIIDGYQLLTYKAFEKGIIKVKYLFIRKLVAQYFLPPPTPEQTFVLYLDYNKNNNRVDNLKWATKNELYAHSKRSPHYIKAWQERRLRGNGKKLTATQVQLIKQKLFDPNRKTRMKMLAKQYGISRTILLRIKNGENWGHVKVKGPTNPKELEWKTATRKGE